MPTLRSAVPVLVAGVLLAACSTGISGAASPQNGAATSPTSPTSPTNFRGCTITTNGRSVSSRSNVGISTSSSNDGTRINCGGAGQLSLISVTDSAIVVVVGGENVTVAAGETKQVGPYQVAVLSINGGTAVFTMAPSI